MITELQPDYAELVSNTYCRFATYFVKVGEGAKVLQLVHDHGLRQGLPSWVPNWSAKYVENRDVSPKKDLGFDIADAYSQAGGDSKLFAAKVQGERLIVKSYLVDVIESTGLASIPIPGHIEDGRNQEMNEDEIALLEGLVECMEEAGKFLDLNAQYPTGEDKGEVLFKTIIGNRKLGTAKEAPENYRSFLVSFMLLLMLGSTFRPGVECLLRRIPTNLFDPDPINVRSGETPKEVIRKATLFCTMAIQQCVAKRRCITKKGYLGQFPLTSRVGDAIYVVAGTPVPFLLRPKGNEYILLGQCYLYGVMKGEVIGECQSLEITIVK
jgi:hypothetical protein